MCIDFENSFYYLFSTIPQVLGALIALFGVFLLFKFQSIKNTIISFGNQTLDYLNNEQFLLDISDRDFNNSKEYLKHGILRQDQETVASQVSGIDQQLKKIDEKELTQNQKLILWKIKHNNEIQFSCLKKRDVLRNKTKHLLYNSVFLIIISLICLPIIPILLNKNNFLLQSIISLIVVLWFGYCLFGIIKVIIESLARDY